MLRRSPRVLLLWAGAAIVAVATALLVGTDLAALHRRAGTLGPEVEVAVAARDLTVGVTVDGDDIRSRRVHQSQLPPGVVAPADVEGRVIAVPILRDGYVAQRNLAPPDRHGLDGVVPAGMRIVRVVVAGPTVGLKAGAAVDVLATFDSGTAIDPAGAAYSEPTVVVARGALVIATDDGDAGEVAEAGGDGVTLLVTEKEALALSYAGAAAVVTVALVPPEDARAPTFDT